MRVLLAEDDPVVGDSLEYALRAVHHSVRRSTGVADTVGLVGDGVADIVLLDIQLDDGSAWDVLDRIAVPHPPFRVSLISATDLAPPLRWSYIPAFRKPLDQDTLGNAIDQAVPFEGSDADPGLANRPAAPWLERLLLADVTVEGPLDPDDAGGRRLGDLADDPGTRGGVRRDQRRLHGRSSCCSPPIPGRRSGCSPRPPPSSPTTGSWSRRTKRCGSPAPPSCSTYSPSSPPRSSASVLIAAGRSLARGRASDAALSRLRLRLTTETMDVPSGAACSTP